LVDAADQALYSVQEKVHNELFQRVNRRLQPEHVKKIDLMMSKDEEGGSPFRAFTRGYQGRFGGHTHFQSATMG